MVGYLRHRGLPSLFIFLFLFPCIVVHGQFYNGSQVTFGKNRVQYQEDRLWHYYSFEQFNTYHYRGGRSLAVYASRYADEQITKMTGLLDHTLHSKVHFIIFNSLNDLKESNIGLISDEQYNVGGVTHLVGNKVFLYFDGDLRSFEGQIRKGVAHVLINQMLAGEDVASAVKSSTLVSLPDWYLNGLISYLADSWSVEADNRMRDGVLSGRYKDFYALQGEEATMAGHSIWKYIADNFGEQSIPSLIYMTKASRSIESAFLLILGSSYNRLLEDWHDYYHTIYSEDSSFFSSIEGDMLQRRPRQNYRYYNPSISPDGTHFIYSRNRLGKLQVYLNNLETGDRDRIFRQGHKLDQKVDYSYPVIAWHPSSKVFRLIVEQRGDIIMYLYDLEEGIIDRQQLYRLDKVLDASYNHRGSNLVLSAVKEGQTDLFVYHLASENLEQITNDVFDVWNPRYINNSRDIVFSSNRTTDTLRDVRLDFRQRGQQDTSVISPYSNIFIYNYSRENRVLHRLTNTTGVNETHPEPFFDGQITYLSDKNGIVNRYVARFDSAISHIDTVVHYRYFTESYPVTNYSRSILDHDVSLESGYIAEHILHEGYHKLFLRPGKEMDSIPQRNIYNTLYRNQLNIKKRILDALPTEREAPAAKKEPARRFIPLKQSHRDTVSPTEDPEKVDIHHYTFEDEPDTPVTPEQPTPKKSWSPPARQNYYVEYTINKLISQIDFSFMNESYQPFTGGGAPIFLNAGFGALIMIGATDMMEDYRLTGGVRLSSSLRNNEYMISYENLKNRINHQWIFHRKPYENTREMLIQRVASHNIYYRATYPFNQVFSIRMTGSARYDRATILATDFHTLQAPDEYFTWGGLKAEAIFDNTRDRGINTLLGTRGKVFSEYYQLFAPEHDNVNLIVTGLDLRNYLRIHRSFVWANRLAASHSFGTSRLIYYMGGVDNWLLPRFNQGTPIDRTQNYAYQTLATPMRGFEQNIRNGNSFALFNSELRFPLVRYFSKRPLRSEFLSSLQLVGFFDAGSAWTGLNPYSEENTIIEEEYVSKPYKVTLRRKVEPFVAGTGMGVRAKIFGYFVRADYAWGIREGVVQDPRFYLSLNLDF